MHPFLSIFFFSFFFFLFILCWGRVGGGCMVCGLYFVGLCRKDTQDARSEEYGVMIQQYRLFLKFLHRTGSKVGGTMAKENSPLS